MRRTDSPRNLHVLESATNSGKEISLTGTLPARKESEGRAMECDMAVGKAKRKERESLPAEAGNVDGPTCKPLKSAKTVAGSPNSTRGDVSQMPTAKKELSPASLAASAAAAKAAADAATDTSAEQESEWRTEGSAYVGRGILRTVQDDDGQNGEGWGKITGWLSREESDFLNDQGEAAALWHVVFDDAALGEEDLEEHEVKAAVIAWELATREVARGGKKKAKVPSAGKGKKGGTTAREVEAAPPSKDFRVYFVEDADGEKGLPQLAKELDVDVADIIRLNSERYKGLKNHSSCRLKPHTVLILPPVGAVEQGDARHNASEVHHAKKSSCEPARPTPVAPSAPAAGLTTAAVVPASAPATQAPPKPVLDPKSALLLLQTERNGMHSGMSTENSASAPCDPSKLEDSSRHSEDSRRRSEEDGGDKSDYLMAMRPSLTFPPFPGVTEGMGAISREYVMDFYCPFVKKQGITYAASGFEAVAPVTAEVEDNWAECDVCQKWRRLPATFIVADGAPFQCSDADRSCEDPEDDWNDDEELEVENEKSAVLESALQNLKIQGLTVLKLGAIKVSKGYWSERHIFPVGYKVRRWYWDSNPDDADESAEKLEKKIEYECVVEEGGDDGPVFSVTPVGPDGELITARRKEGDSAAKAWSSIVAARDGGAGEGAGAEAATKPSPAGEDGRHGGADSATAPSSEPAAAGDNNEGGAEEIRAGAGEDGEKEQGEVGKEEIAGHWERDEEGNRRWVTRHNTAGNETQDVEVKAASRADAAGGKADEGAGAGRKKQIVKGNELFGLSCDEVKELIWQLDGADEIVRSMERNSRKRHGGSLEERIKDMPRHYYQHESKNLRVPVRNQKTRRYLIGDEAPRAKEIKKFLQDNPDMVCIDPSTFNRADEVMLEEYCAGLKLCYDCKKGVFANKGHTKFACRFKMQHTGPGTFGVLPCVVPACVLSLPDTAVNTSDWKKDPREKDKDPLSHIRLVPRVEVCVCV